MCNISCLASLLVQLEMQRRRTERLQLALDQPCMAAVQVLSGTTQHSPRFTTWHSRPTMSVLVREDNRRAARRTRQCCELSKRGRSPRSADLNRREGNHSSTNMRVRQSHTGHYRTRTEAYGTVRGTSESNGGLGGQPVTADSTAAARPPAPAQPCRRAVYALLTPCARSPS